jgi:hypothetical protein
MNLRITELSIIFSEINISHRELRLTSGDVDYGLYPKLRNCIII